MHLINIVAGLGEIGQPICDIFEGKGYDINNYKSISSEGGMLHICIPFTEGFEDNVLELITLSKPDIVVIHSTISPEITRNIQDLLSIPVVYSPVRGVHARMKEDLLHYTKYIAVDEDTPKREWALSTVIKEFESRGIKTKTMKNTLTLEFAKILTDTTYYGYLINYAQITKMIAETYHFDYDEMWEFSDEIHEKLGNRPKMIPNVIGGHCVIPNLNLLPDDYLAKFVYDTNSIFKRTRHDNRV